MVGQTYVATYYPKNNEEPIAVVKERILADIGSLPQEEKKNQQQRAFILPYRTLRRPICRGSSLSGEEDPVQVAKRQVH